MYKPSCGNCQGVARTLAKNWPDFLSVNTYNKLPQDIKIRQET